MSENYQHWFILFLKMKLKSTILSTDMAIFHIKNGLNAEYDVSLKHIRV
jgi:hypothetical protein